MEDILLSAINNRLLIQFFRTTTSPAYLPISYSTNKYIITQGSQYGTAGTATNGEAYYNVTNSQFNYAKYLADATSWITIGY